MTSRLVRRVLEPPWTTALPYTASVSVERAAMTAPFPEGFQGTWDAFPDPADKPRLLLGYRLTWQDAQAPRESSPLSYPVKPERTWLKLDHQTAEVGCHHVYLYVTELEPKPHVLPILKELAEHYHGALGWEPPSLDEANAYRAVLQAKLEVDCNRSYVELEEALYPIDPSKEHLARLSSDLPDEPGDLSDWDNAPSAPLFRLRVGLHLRFYLIAENSD